MTMKDYALGGLIGIGLAALFCVVVYFFFMEQAISVLLWWLKIIT